MGCRCPQGVLVLSGEDYSRTGLDTNKVDQVQSWALCEVPWSYKAYSHQKRLLVSMKEPTEHLCAVLGPVLSTGYAKEASPSRLSEAYGSAIA